METGNAKGAGQSDAPVPTEKEGSGRREEPVRARRRVPTIGEKTESKIKHPNPPAADPFSEAVELLDRINESVSGYDPVLREKAVAILMDRAFGSVQRQSASGGLPLQDERRWNTVPSVDFASLVEKWRPSTQPHWALLGAYFQTKLQGKETVSGQEINSVLKHHGTIVRNITDALGANITSKPALILQVGKSGSSRQARKTYKVTTQGIQYVEGRLRGVPEEAST